MTLTARLTAAEQRLNGLNLARLFRSPLADLAVGAGLTLLALLPALTSGVLEKDGMRAAAVVAFLVLATLPQAIRHRHPVATVALTFIGALGLLLYGVAPYDMGIGVHLSGFLSYLTLVRLLPRGTAWFLTAALATGLTVLGFLSGSLFWIVCALGAGGATLLMELSRSRGEVREVRQENLEALREQAAMAERTRIAREMHDVVAHRVSLMVLHAGGLEVSAPDERTAEIAELIRTTGREALSELREILGVLRNGEAAPTAPQPVLDDVGSLIDAACAAGANVDLTTTGTPRPLNAQVERTAYRVVQEALTNAVKHAPGAEIDVRIDYGRTALTVTVVNGPATVKVANPVPDSGYGLIGLRERLALVGGTFVAGPLADGGWWVRAIIPAAPTETPRPAEEIS